MPWEKGLRQAALARYFRRFCAGHGAGGGRLDAPHRPAPKESGRRAGAGRGLERAPSKVGHFTHLLREMTLPRVLRRLQLPKPRRPDRQPPDMFMSYRIPRGPAEAAIYPSTS